MTSLACVEVGGSGCQTVVFDDSSWLTLDGAHRPDGTDLAIAAPGYLRDGRVMWASNLGWRDVDPAEQLGLTGPSLVLLNDAEAAALGEAALRADAGRAAVVAAGLTFVGVGTGIGGAVIDDGRVTATNLFGHASGFSSLPCPCGRVGCLETVAAGWALPDEIDRSTQRNVAGALAAAIEAEPRAAHTLVVIGGGLVAAHPYVVEVVSGLLPGRRVEPSAAPGEAKSASAWGLRHVVEGLTTPGV